MIVSLGHAARAEAKAATEWYIEQGAGDAAVRFTEELDRALRVLSRFPAIGKPGYLDTRAFHLRTFPYSLIYRARDGTIKVIAVAHQRRHPGYWKARD